MSIIKITTSWSEYVAIASIPERQFMFQTISNISPKLRAHYLAIKRLGEKMPYDIGISNLLGNAEDSWFKGAE